MKNAAKILCVICVATVFAALSAKALSGDKVRFTLDGGGAVRTPGLDGEIFSANDIISSATASGKLPLPDFYGKDRIVIDALIVDPDKIIFSSDVDFTINGNNYADEDLVEYDLNTKTFSMFLDGSAIGIPQRLDIDAVTEYDDHEIWFSVDGSFGTMSPNDVFQYSFTNHQFTVIFDGNSVLKLPDNSNIDALHYDGQNLYFSLDTTETTGAGTARDEDVIVYNMSLGDVTTIITNLHIEPVADVNALDEWDDTDNDGLTDFEEHTGLDEGGNQYEGTSAALSPNGYTSDPYDQDTDNDGASDGKEAVCGTDPNSAASVFKITSISNAPAGQIIHWLSVPGKYYKVYNSDDSMAFTNCVAPSVPAAGQDTSWTNNAGGQGRFFRINLDLNP